MTQIQLPDEFFYYSAESQLDYTTTPGEDIDIDRFLNGNPEYWINYQEPKVKKKKKLFLANWGVMHYKWSTSEEEIKQKIIELMKLGFDIYYVRRESGFSAFNHSELAFSTFNHKERIIHLNQIADLSDLSDILCEIGLSGGLRGHPDKIMAELLDLCHLSHDECHILDDRWLDYLLHNGKKPNYISIDSSMGMGIDTLGYNVSDIDQTIFSHDINKTVQQLKQKFPAAITHENYVEILLTDAQISAAFAEALFQDTSYSYESATITPDQIKQIRSLKLNCQNISEEVLDVILRKHTSLTYLSLTQAKTLNIASLSSSALKEIHISNSTIKGNITHHFSPNIIELKNTTISTQDLEQWLATSPQLLTLDISSCTTTNGMLNPVSLPDLWLLEINASQYDFIKNLVHNAPKLSHLHITGDIHPALEEAINSLKGITTSYRYNHTSTTLNDAANPTHFNALPESLSSSPKTSVTLDAKTFTPDDTKFTVQNIFRKTKKHQKVPDPSEYRLQIYNAITINPKPCTMSNAFTLYKKGDLALEPCPNVLQKATDVLDSAKDQEQVFYGKQELHLTSEWKALASLSPKETLLSYHLSPQVAIELKYSKRDNLYYLRATEQENIRITIDFLLSVPKKSPKPPREIHHLVEKYRKKFTNAALNITRENPTGADYLQAIQQQQKGACRHRAFAFKAEMEKLHPEIPVRIIYNDCHAYAEIYSQKSWVSCDLGGASAHIEIYKPESEPNLDTPTTNNALPTPAIANTPEERLLQTWVKNEDITTSVTAFCQQILQPDGHKKKLIELTTTPDVYALHLLLQRYCLHTQRAVFCINTPQDLVCAAPWMEAQEEKDGIIAGALKKGPGGRLHRFLTEHAEKECFLLINYTHFSPADIVRCNTMLDTIPNIDGIELPPNARVIGLMNMHSPSAYKGEDFRSRIDIKTPGPDSIKIQEAISTYKKIQEAISTYNIKVSKQPAPDDAEHLYLFNSQNWKNILLGNWVMQGKKLEYIEGILQPALKTNKSLVIHHGLWENPDFCAFWEQIHLKGVIEYPDGRTQTIPKQLTLFRVDTYEWDELTKNLVGAPQPLEATEILNPTRLMYYFQHYEYDKDAEELNLLPGHLATWARNQRTAVDVHLTRNLTDDQWAMLGHQCNVHKITINIHPLPGVTLPPYLKGETPNIPPSSGWQRILSPADPPTLVINSTDINASVAHLTLRDASWHVIDVTGCKSSDLLRRVSAYFDQKTLGYGFSQHNQALITALELGQKIILKGTFSPELVDELAPLLLARKQQVAPTPLIIVCTENSIIPFVTAQTHRVNSWDKKFLCPEDGRSAITAPMWDKESYSKICARIAHQKAHPEADSAHAWLGLTDAPLPSALRPLNKEDDCKALSVAFNQERRKRIFTTLQYSPYVYLTGLTGVGKSTFVEKYIKTDPQVHFYQGINALKQWAEDKNKDTLNLLFVDEINLSHHNWNSFIEGLFHNPPGVLIDGTYYPLTPQHKFICAGNPNSYGDERRLEDAFIQHGSAILFEPLPLECIYEELLKPMFAQTTLEQNHWELCQPILEVYSFLCKHAKNEVLISPRSLQMMAALTMATPENASEAVYMHVYNITKNLVPTEHLPEFLKLPCIIKAHSLKPPVLTDFTDHKADYLITPSRQPIIKQLTDLLTLNEYRKNNAAQANEVQLYAGLGGVCLTGAPGVGKSDLVISVLRQRGYDERHFLSTKAQKPEITQKIFYRLSASLTTKVKEELILKAFDEGAVVVIDELNSSPFMELWLNDLLMGIHPVTKKHPATPGFCIIATQNPATMAGRKNQSPALFHRFMHINVAEYPFDELCAILEQSGLRPEKANHLATAYQKNLEYARHHNLSPAPTFRDLLKVAKLLQNTPYNRMIHKLEAHINQLSSDAIKNSAHNVLRTIIEIAEKSDAANEEFLMPYLIATEKLLTSSAEDLSSNIENFHNLAQKAPGAPSPLWKKLATAMLGLALIITIAAVLTLSLTGFGIIPVTLFAAGGLATASSIGFFAASKHEKGLSQAMLDLENNLRTHKK